MFKSARTFSSLALTSIVAFQSIFSPVAYGKYQTSDADQPAPRWNLKFNPELAPKSPSLLPDAKLPGVKRTFVASAIAAPESVKIQPQKGLEPLVDVRGVIELLSKKDSLAVYLIPLSSDCGKAPAEPVSLGQKIVDVIKKSDIQWERLGKVTLALTAFQTGAVTLMTQLPMSVTGWNGRAPNFNNPRRSFEFGPRMDEDHWYWNYAAHPVVGAEYYLLARNRGANWWESLIYSTAMSAFWEYGPEAVYERASIQDLIITPGAGAIIGEARYQAIKALTDPKTGKADTKFKQVLVIILDPIEALSK